MFSRCAPVWSIPNTKRRRILVKKLWSYYEKHVLKGGGVSPQQQITGPQQQAKTKRLRQANPARGLAEGHQYMKKGYLY